MKKVLTIIFIIAALQLAVVSVASADGGVSGGGGNSYHRVQYGETLFSIGRQYGVSAYRIADANGLRNPNRIYAGQVLYIPSGGYGDCYNQGCGNNGGQGFHIVRYGETLYSIGRQYNVHPDHIAQVNNLYNPNYIYVGQRLRIPSGSSYPWNGGCGGYGYGCNYNSGCGSGYGSGCNWNNSGCGGYGSGCNWNNSGCDGYNSGCNWNNSGCDGYGSGCNWHNSGCDNFGNGCSYSGYDYTGYYYNRGNQRYSFTCGQNFNCW